MGLLSRLLGNASEADVADVEEYLEKILAEGEKVQRAFALVRDLFIFTDRRFIMVDKQGMTGMKTEFHSIPYRAIARFSVETAGPTDLRLGAAHLGVGLELADSEDVQARLGDLRGAAGAGDLLQIVLRIC